MDSFFDFIKHHPPVKRLQVNDLLLAEYQCPLSQFRYNIWSHHNYFVYVISGKKKWSNHSQEFLVQKGDCLFIRKGAHSVYQFFDADFCAIVLFVPDAFIRTVLLENHIAIGIPNEFSKHDALFSLGAADQLAAYFHSFYAYLTAPQCPSASLMELKFKELILLASSQSCHKNLSNYFASLCKAGHPSLFEIMEGNYSYPMSMEEYARLCNRSLSTFKRDFKRAFGTSPGRWLTQKRLDLAKYLLEQSSKTVTEAALDSGFKNHSHFSRVFKEKFGLPPKDLVKSKPGQDLDG